MKADDAPALALTADVRPAGEPLLKVTMPEPMAWRTHAGAPPERFAMLAVAVGEGDAFAEAWPGRLCADMMVQITGTIAPTILTTRPEAGEVYVIFLARRARNPVAGRPDGARGGRALARRHHRRRGVDHAPVRAMKIAAAVPTSLEIQIVDSTKMGDARRTWVVGEITARALVSIVGPDGREITTARDVPTKLTAEERALAVALVARIERRLEAEIAP